MSIESELLPEVPSEESAKPKRKTSIERFNERAQVAAAGDFEIPQSVKDLKETIQEVLKEKEEKHLDRLSDEQVARLVEARLKRQQSQRKVRWSDERIQHHFQRRPKAQQLLAANKGHDVHAQVGLDTLVLEGDTRKLNWNTKIVVARDFRPAQFEKAQFRSAVLVGTDFSFATLTLADFRGADLRGCNFSFADLSGIKIDADTDFTGAILDGAKLPPDLNPKTLRHQPLETSP